MSNMYWLVPLLYYPAWQVDILGQIIWFCLMSNEFPSQSLKLSFYCFTLTKMKKKCFWAWEWNWHLEKPVQMVWPQKLFTIHSSVIYMYFLRPLHPFVILYYDWSSELRRPADMLKFWECLRLQSATVYPNLCYGYRYTLRYL